MTWTTYEVVFRLKTPMHIGAGKVGNLQQTRSYVAGQTFWGALTHRLTRDQYHGVGAATDSALYKIIGEQVNNHLAYTYFYPALKESDSYTVHFPWENKTAFTQRFLNSYASTALVYPQQAAAEGTLHEIEFVSPQTMEMNSQPVYLLGYIFEHTDTDLSWQDALNRLQLGGERGYGWGAVSLVHIRAIDSSDTLFNLSTFSVDTTNTRPHISVAENTHLLAHTYHDGMQIKGRIEPLVSRQWDSTRESNQYAGQLLSFSGQAFTPGSITVSPATIAINPFGLWNAV